MKLTNEEFQQPSKSRVKYWQEKALPCGEVSLVSRKGLIDKKN
jgi:hypothetical protein